MCSILIGSRVFDWLIISVQQTTVLEVSPPKPTERQVMLIENGAVRLELLELMRLQGWETPHNLTPQWINTVLQLQWVKAKDGVFRAQLGGRFPTEEEMVLLRQLGADATPIDRTNTELNGFFKARRWDARSASH